jgi:two-component sensor histidine kinase
MAAPTSTEKEDAALSLTVAVVASSNGPLLLLDEGLNGVVASGSFCRAFAIDPATVVGVPVFDLGHGEWRVPQLRSLLMATAAGDPPIEAYEFDLARAGAEVRRLSVHAQRLAYLDLDAVRILVALTDVTDARADAKAKERLARENAVLLQEVRHRVANSLQIIASVLLQGARKTQSEDARSHLRDAHNRVMSVAALERQLSASTGDQVHMRTYLAKLCESIGDSMIHDHGRISIAVISDDAIVSGNLSVSLGLIATELVINSLKHGFPDGGTGKITVTYKEEGGSWTLSVNDDGVGMPPDTAKAVAGLGTSIVQALARQLAATVHVADAHPGVFVSIAHQAHGAEPSKGAVAAI